MVRIVKPAAPWQGGCNLWSPSARWP
jgi:hypothetical protein